MIYLRYLCVALASALVAAYAALWFASPSPLERPVVTIPPLTLEHGSDLLIWGGWKTLEGYAYGDKSAVEIRCSRSLNTCTEAEATLLIHDEGQDLEAHVRTYQVTSWDDMYIEAVGTGPDSECPRRKLLVNIHEKLVRVSWKPSYGCESSDTGSVELIGDPL